MCRHPSATTPASAPTADEVLPLLRAHHQSWADRFHLRRIGLFGTVGCGEATPPYATVHLKQELEQVLQRPVDLVRLPSDNQMGTNSHESRRWCGWIPRQPVCSDVGRKPGIEIGHALKIEQGFGQGLQPLQRQAANQAFLLRAQGPTAAD